MRERDARLREGERLGVLETESVSWNGASPASAQPSTPDRLPVSIVRLLMSYQLLLNYLDRMPSVVFVCSEEGGSVLGRRPRLRYRRLLRHLMYLHMAKTIASLKRRYYAQQTLGYSEQRQADIDRLERFERSLPDTYSTRMLLFAVAVATLLGAWAFTAGTHSALACPLEGAWKSLLTLDRAGLMSAIEGGEGCDAPLIRFAFGAFVTLAMVSWVVLFIPANVFRTKRLLFSSYVEPMDEQTYLDCVKRSTSEDHLTGCDGVYAIERDLFRDAQAQPVRELPLDLAVSALIFLAVLSTVVGGLFFVLGSSAQLQQRAVVAFLVVFLAIIAEFDVVRLRRRWSSRDPAFASNLEARASSSRADR
jgi:hypothetical protein